MNVSIQLMALGVYLCQQKMIGNRGLSGEHCVRSFALVPLAVCFKGVMIDANLGHLARDLKREYIHLTIASSWKSCCRGTETVTLKKILSIYLTQTASMRISLIHPLQ